MTAGLTERQVAKREQIATAARKLFLELGFAGTSMDAVSAEAGVSKQTLYTYFPAKVDLLGDILDGELSRIDLEGRSPSRRRSPSCADVLVQFASRLTHMPAAPRFGRPDPPGARRGLPDPGAAQARSARPCPCAPCTASLPSSGTRHDSA